MKIWEPKLLGTKEVKEEYIQGPAVGKPTNGLKKFQLGLPKFKNGKDMGNDGLEDILWKGTLEGPMEVPKILVGIVVETSIGYEAKEVVIVELIRFSQGYSLMCTSTGPK